MKKTHYKTIIDGIIYCNDGDWCETCSALVETTDVVFKILEFSDYRN